MKYMQVGFFYLVLMVFTITKAETSISVLKTGITKSKEGLVVSGGSMSQDMVLNQSAFLIKHESKNGLQYILVDTGLGSQIVDQFKKDMPIWAQPFFKYQDVTPATHQLPIEVKQEIKSILLTHVHWDHASGLVDFPERCVIISPEEISEVKNPARAATFPSQLKQAKWCPFEWKDVSYKGFSKSYDVFGDGSVVAVPLMGHTKGSIGLFVKTKSKDLFLVGDLTWNAKALLAGKQKFIAASWIVDGSRKEVQKTIEQVQDLIKKNPMIQLIPSHDKEAQDSLSYFPEWTQ